MSFAWLDAPLIEIFGHDISLLGIIAFVGFFSAGLLGAKIIQGDVPAGIDFLDVNGIHVQILPPARA